MKTKCYRFDNEQEFDALVEKYGSTLYYIPNFYKNETKAGFLYDAKTYAGSLAKWTSASVKEFKAERTYGNCEMITFAAAMNPQPIKNMKLKCINANDSNSLVLGNTYTLLEENEHGNIRVSDDFDGRVLTHYYKPDRFVEVVEKAIVFEVGKEYETRDGHPAKVLAISSDKEYPLVGEVREDDGVWYNQTWTRQGCRIGVGDDDDYDLKEPRPKQYVMDGVFNVVINRETKRVILGGSSYTFEDLQKIAKEIEQ